MLIENRWLIEKFIRKHADARVRMKEWLEKVQVARWHNFSDVRQTFNSVDKVGSLVIFNVGGNNYRVAAEVAYAKQMVRIALVGTHTEYDGWTL